MKKIEVDAVANMKYGKTAEVTWFMNRSVADSRLRQSMLTGLD